MSDRPTDGRRFTAREVRQMANQSLYAIVEGQQWQTVRAMLDVLARQLEEQELVLESRRG